MKVTLKYAFLIFAVVIVAACVKEPCISEQEKLQDQRESAYVFVKIGGSEVTKALSAREDVYIGNVAMALYDSQTGAVVAHTGQAGASTSSNSLYSAYWNSGKYYNSTEIPELALRVDKTVLESHSRFRLAVVVNMHGGGYGYNMYQPSKNGGFFGDSRSTGYNNFSYLKSHLLSSWAVADNYNSSNTLLEDLTPICSVTIDDITFSPGVNYVGYTDAEIGAMSLSDINSMLGLSGSDQITSPISKHNLNEALSIENDMLYVQPVFSRVQLDNVAYDKQHFYLEHAFILNGKHVAYLFDDCVLPESKKPSAHATTFRHAYVQTGTAAAGSGWITDLYNWINGDDAPITDFDRLDMANLSSTDGITALDNFTSSSSQPAGTTAPANPNSSAYRTDMTHVHKHIVKLSDANSYASFSEYIASVAPSVWGAGNYNHSSKYPYYAPLTRADAVTKPITSTQKTAYFKLPFFYVYPNDGSDETSVDENGDRNYNYATYLVVRGYWKDDDSVWSSSEETRKTQGHIVYYPILINGNQKGLSVDYGSTPLDERGTLLKRNRLYRLSLKINSEGVRNPWARSTFVEKNSVTISLTIDPEWISGGRQDITLK